MYVFCVFSKDKLENNNFVDFYLAKKLCYENGVRLYSLIQLAGFLSYLLRHSGVSFFGIFLNQKLKKKKEKKKKKLQKKNWKINFF